MAPPSSFLSPNFPILAIIISGILTTTLILVSFYFFITKCHLRNSNNAQTTPVVPTFQMKSQGLKPSLIRAIPIAKFSKSSFSTILCTICLNEFRAEEKLRLLPNCSHAFHIDCIDTWLQSNTNCPLCRVCITNPVLHWKQVHGTTTLDNEREEEEVREENYSIGREVFKKKNGSSGDECIVHVRETEEELRIQPLRRSLSLDSSTERQIYLSVQEMLQKRQQNQSEIEDGGESSTRSLQCFSFSQSRSWRKPVRRVG
ncbi:Ring-h2 finger protein atl1 [Rhynchospora pubera]|uniref:RING-type E3 ubiquitin transferase n=1 Tax=Rhynchospora pubera TaxID=906938 RepID=A0AAV8EAE6_9POAL|nr:Ring-h2 finger protein atl1 [Rhynchospora pubera]